MNVPGVIDKHGVLRDLGARRPVRVELGCGPRKLHPEALGIDAIDAAGVDLVGDATEALRLFPDASVQCVSSSHFLEHVADLDALLREVARVLMDGGELEATVPHFSNPYFYSDPTHTRAFGLYSFSYLARGGRFTRQVPNYGRDYGFELVDVALRFRSPFKGRDLVRRLVDRLVNASTYTMELWYKLRRVSRGVRER